jgi:hypothetical protein
MLGFVSSIRGAENGWSWNKGGKGNTRRMSVQMIFFNAAAAADKS